MVEQGIIDWLAIVLLGGYGFDVRVQDAFCARHDKGFRDLG